MSEYAKSSVRNTAKPIIEILAGIPNKSQSHPLLGHWGDQSVLMFHQKNYLHVIKIYLLLYILTTLLVSS